jgi:hypothetical protein
MFPVYAFPVQIRAVAKNDTKARSAESEDLMQFDKVTLQPQDSLQAQETIQAEETLQAQEAPAEETPQAPGTGLAPQLLEHIVSTLYIQPSFLKQVAEALPEDISFRKIYSEMYRTYNNTVHDKNGPVTTLYNFRRDTKSKLLFFRDNNRERLYIPYRCLKILLKMAYDSITYIGVERIFQVLRQHVFFPRMKKEILKYTSNCPVCSKAKPSRIRP